MSKGLLNNHNPADRFCIFLSSMHLSNKSPLRKGLWRKGPLHTKSPLHMDLLHTGPWNTGPSFLMVDSRT